MLYAMTASIPFAEGPHARDAGQKATKELQAYIPVHARQAQLPDAKWRRFEPRAEHDAGLPWST